MWLSSDQWDVVQRDVTTSRPGPLDPLKHNPSFLIFCLHEIFWGPKRWKDLGSLVLLGELPWGTVSSRDNSSQDICWKGSKFVLVKPLRFLELFDGAASYPNTVGIQYVFVNTWLNECWWKGWSISLCSKLAVLAGSLRKVGFWQ